MASPVVTPKKKTCVMCQEEKGRTAFIKDGDLCTKCRNTETNPLCLKRGQPPTWSSVLSPARKSDPHIGSGTPSRLLATSVQHSKSQLTNSSPLEEKNMLVTSDTSVKTLEHKIDLMLESVLEMERNQIQVASIRSEMHKFLVELSHLNNNAEPEEDQKYAGLDSLTATMEQRFVSMRNDISSLQATISTLGSEIMSSISQHSKAIEDSWKVEAERREQIWQDRLMEERRVWNERFVEERKQWQQYMQQHTFQLHHMLQEGMKQSRQEYHRSNSETFLRTENRTSETSNVLSPPVTNTDSSSVNTGGSSNTSVSLSTVPALGIISVGMNNLSIEPFTSQVLAIPLNSVLETPMSIMHKPPKIIIKRPVVKIK
jgi:hypothetical protein